jgi:hypothetical protein
MAKAASKKPAKAEWKGFHNVNLSKDDEVRFLAWQQENIVGMPHLEFWATNGYKVSFDFDAYNEGCRASLYCTMAKMEWAGYTLSAWAEDMQTALNLLCFKHEVMCKGTWEVAKDNPKKGTSSFG